MSWPKLPDFPDLRPARNATVGSYGCGIRCRVAGKLLSSPNKIKDGWTKVLAKEDIFVGGYFSSSSQFWQFAKCDGDLIGECFRSDMSDAKIQKIYYASGLKKMTMPVELFTIDGKLYAAPITANDSV